MGPKSEQIQDSKQTKNTAGNYCNSLVPVHVTVEPVLTLFG